MPLLKLDKNNAAQIINALTTVVSAECEPLKIKFTTKDTLELLATDKSQDLDVFVTLPLLGVEKEQQWQMPINRWKLLCVKQKQVDLELKRGILHYKYGKGHGTIETEESNTSWTFPTAKNDSHVFNGLLLKLSQLVKLPAMVGEHEVNLFVDYHKKTKTLRLASANNFNVAYCQMHDIDLWETNLQTVVPFKYVEYARKFASFADDNKIHLSNTNNQFFLCTKHAVIQLPSYAVDQTQINMPAIVEHVEKSNKIKGIAFDLLEFKQFMLNSVTIKEADRNAVLYIKAKKGEVLYRIQTKHGQIQHRTEAKTIDREFDIYVSCGFMQNLLNRIEEDMTCQYKRVGNILHVVAKTPTTVLNLSTNGVSND